MAKFDEKKWNAEYKRKMIVTNKRIMSKRNPSVQIDRTKGEFNIIDRRKDDNWHISIPRYEKAHNYKKNLSRSKIKELKQVVVMDATNGSTWVSFLDKKGDVVRVEDSTHWNTNQEMTLAATAEALGRNIPLLDRDYGKTYSVAQLKRKISQAT
jgi:hypothetical protein